MGLIVGVIAAFFCIIVLSAALLAFGSWMDDEGGSVLVFTILAVAIAYIFWR